MSLPPGFAGALAGVRLGRLGSSILFYPSIGSTNDVAVSIATRGWPDAVSPQSVEGLVVCADEQTAGRGRRGHAWFSPPGSGLYVSVVLAPGAARVDPERATMLLTLMAGVAVAEGIEAAAGLRADLKWPNDLLVGGRKLCGILAEGVRIPATADPTRINTVVVGFGINIRAAAYPPELSGRVTSIEAERGPVVDRARVLAQTLAALSTRYDDLLEGRFDAILDVWRNRAPASVGARVTWQTPAGPQSGVTAGVDECGALQVRIGSRIERIVGGELLWS
jgi:BirA family transcriptional regulator, biotin operon repressor / biotin---[acetyl-CoA-carboxylase] ligase